MSSITKKVALLIAIFTMSAVLSYAAFAGIATPFGTFGPRNTQIAIASTLDYPVAVLNRFLPERAKTHMTVHLQCNHTYCFPDAYPVEAFRYVRVGTVAYSLLGLSPFAVRKVASKSHRRN